MTSLLPSSGEKRLGLQAIREMHYAFARTAILVASIPLLRLFTHLTHRALTPLELAACADTGPPTLTADLSMVVSTAQGRIGVLSEVAGWLTERGLRDVQRFHVAGPFPTVIARKAEGVSCAASLLLDQE